MPLADQIFLMNEFSSMGSCLCKEKKRKRRDGTEESTSTESDSYRPDGSRQRQTQSRRRTPRQDQIYQSDPSIYNDCRELIRQTLKVIRTLVNNEQEPPASLMKLNMIAEREQGWLIVVRALIDLVPDSDSLGPAVITLFLDECPLPSRETIHKLLYNLDLGSSTVDSYDASWNKNACIVLGSLAEKLAGSSSVGMCNEKTLSYLIRNLSPERPEQVILFSLIALEKFAQTSENQNLIMRYFDSCPRHPLQILEERLHNPSYEGRFIAQQVGFCAQWSLDNIFVKPNRIYAYETADVTNINAMLNHEDVSEYLKIGPDGLEARCDVSSFESVRCTFEVLEGVWYYEATVLTPGVMQIGFATKRSRFLNHEGYGIGDDDSSVAYDGCRQLLWHNANSSKHEHPHWVPGDVLGCLLDLPRGEVLFYLNGIPLLRPHTEFLANRPSTDGVFAAASFMSFQQCRFNFGARPFSFPPNCVCRSFNEGGAVLSPQQKSILPRKRRLEILQREPIPDDFCTICFSNPGDHTLMPCTHDGFCGECALQLEVCPLCRSEIDYRQTASPSRPIDISARLETVL